MKLSIIIVSWNVRDLLAACLNSIDPHCEIIVVDSASSDDTVAMVSREYPWVKLIAQQENVGFTRGNNIGLSAAEGEYMMLLNPDTQVIEDALIKMVEFLDANPEVGIVGPQTFNTDGTHQSTRRRFPTLLTAIFESTWLQPFAPRRILDHFYVRDVEDSATADVDWVQGSALMARREVYEQIGGLDEHYIMFSEEMDWCKRAKIAGWRVAYLGDAHIIHHGGKSTEQVTARKHIYFQSSKLYYFRKFHGAAAALVLRIVLLANYGVQLIIEWVKGILGHKRDMRRERVRVYWQVIVSLCASV